MMAIFKYLLFLHSVLCLLGYHYIYARNRFVNKKKSNIQGYRNPAVCKRILACTGIDNILRRNLLGATVSRALPNGRLARAFKIKNAFTAMSENDRIAFRNHAKEKLRRVDENQWKDIARLATQILREKVQVCSEGQTRIHLVTLIQALSLKMSFYVLYQQDPLTLDDKAVSSLAWTINALWIMSKKIYPNEKQMKFHQHNLSKDLNTLLPNHSLTCPRETPMNFIIPAYETLWRVVLQGFIEVTFRHPASADVWRSVLAEYVAQPDADQFSKRLSEPPGDTPSISAKDLAQEALRLYPPTKRVYRTFRYPNCPELVTVAANIEHIHRNPKLWGPDSTMYVPGRWASEARNVSKKFFPFGGEPMVCPAKEKFGPMMIGILLAVLSNEFEAGLWKLEGDEAGEAKMKEWEKKASQPLDSSRKAHASLYLCRKRDY